MSETRYTTEHEWIKLAADSTAIIGITDYAQEQLGDVVYVELPACDRKLGKNEVAVIIESVKAASDIKMSLAGRVTQINEALTDCPELINTAPETDGWLIKIKLDDPIELTTLMDQKSYQVFIAGL